MSVLSDLDLKRILDNEEGIIILRHREKSITGVGYDLTIGFIRDSATGKIPETITDEDNTIRYTLLSGHRYLVISKEFLYLSSQYMATLHSRGSYVLKGIIITSTTIDPNYIGCITGSLFNCSSEPIYIKKENQFATMVFHKLNTATNSILQINERGNPMDAQETFHGRYPNIHSDACEAGDAYYGYVRKIVEREFLDILERMHQKAKISMGKNNKQEYEEKSFSKETQSQKVTEDVAKESKTIIKITFLVGNGFDLNVGLNTRYNDFYDYYIKKYPDDLIAKDINQDIDKWSDLELELGRFTGKISPQTKDEFWDSENNLENTIIEYLEKEMERFHFENSNIRSKVETGILNLLKYFYKKNSKESIENLKNVLENTNNLIEYSFITFNYTNTLELCLNTLGERLEPIFITPYENKKVLDIHGSVFDGRIVLGVNDECQIENKDFRDSDSKKYLIKSEINDSYKNTRKKDAESIIDSSNIICIFGMSLGETDQMWWQHIAKWLQKDNSRELVIFFHTKEDLRIQKAIQQQEKKVLNSFFDVGKVSVNVRKQIKNQIHVIINTNLLQIKLV